MNALPDPAGTWGEEIFDSRGLLQKSKGEALFLASC
jgi:hypothetical protein